MEVYKIIKKHRQDSQNLILPGQKCQRQRGHSFKDQREKGDVQENLKTKDDYTQEWWVP